MGFLKKSKDPDQGEQATKTPFVVAIEQLLMDITPQAPSGEKDMSDDPAFVDLGIKIRGTPERELGGKIVQEAKQPKWPEIQKSAFELLTRTHDLRVAMFLMRALLHTKGVAGLYTGLELINGYIEDYWETLFPQLDPQENNDPIARINILSALGEGHDIIDPLMQTRLYSPQPMVQVSLRDIHVATGKIAVKEEGKQSAVSPAMLEEAFKDCDVKVLKATHNAISQSIDSLKRLESTLDEKVGSANALNNQRLRSILKEMDLFFENRLPDRTSTQPAPLDRPPDFQGRSIETDVPMETITNRNDVIRLLDQICSYYDHNEPASPVPLLLKRARQLVEKNFYEIVQDLAPESAEQVMKLIGGVKDEKS